MLLIKVPGKFEDAEEYYEKHGQQNGALNKCRASNVTPDYSQRTHGSP
jgi:hypothetical protein